MDYSFCEYKNNLFFEIRDFLIQTYNEESYRFNWFMDRWNFCRYFSHVTHDVVNTWPDTVGIWRNMEGQIIGVVNSEGENRGEAFFQLKNLQNPKNLYIDMLRFAESKLACKENDDMILNVRVDVNDHELINLFKENEYEQTDKKECTCSMLLKNNKKIEIGDGFRITDGLEVSGRQRADAHIKAFGINDADKETRIIANNTLRLSPDYDPSLDISAVDDKNEVASFATIWFDEKNKIGIYEPVGTVPEYRNRGLGRAVIYTGMNKLLKLGCRKVYVGSDQLFYKSLGFTVDFIKEIWQKRWTIDQYGGLSRVPAASIPEA